MKFARAASTIYGACEPTLHRLVAKRMDALVDQLLLAAIGEWREVGYARFDDHEVNCSVQIVRFAEIVRRRSRELRILRVQPEMPMPNLDILEGRASADTSCRPDLRITLGDTGRTVECKLLSVTGGLARLYVKEGIARFVSGKYAPDEEAGRMLGYILEGEIEAVADRVNSQVQDLFDESHCLRPGMRLAGQVVGTFDSNHARAPMADVQLTHFLTKIG